MHRTFKDIAAAALDRFKTSCEPAEYRRRLATLVVAIHTAVIDERMACASLAKGIAAEYADKGKQDISAAIDSVRLRIRGRRSSFGLRARPAP